MHPAYGSSDSPLNGFPFYPRVTGWGLAGNNGIFLGDGMLPFVGNNDMILYTDGQSKYAAHTNANWFGGLGVGARKVFNDSRIFGGYAFVDRSLYTAPNTNSETFWTFNLGLESLGQTWDFRVNSYIPITSTTINSGTFFADQAPGGTVFGDHFIAHQQFGQQVTNYANTSFGFDGEVGRIIHTPQLRAFLGGYHFSIPHTNDITGGSTRVEYAFNHYFGAVANYTYDNQFRNSIQLGLRFTLGGIPNDQTGKDIQRRLMDPITRNLATNSQGTSVPIVTTQTLANNGAFVIETDDIYFFTPTGGSAYDPGQGTNNCTFENPCDGTFFTQATLDSITIFTPNANLFFEPGTYNNFAGQITINGGQSLFGRTEGFISRAQGNDRALFLGGMSLTGDNLLDSIRLLNSIAGPASVIALNIQNASNIRLFNTDIQAVSAVVGDSALNNNAAAIYANNSEVTINSSTISATASITGTNTALNQAVGIGGNNNSFANNTFTINNSTVSATTSVGGLNNSTNQTSAIGGNAQTGAANFTNNNFTISNSQLTSSGSIGGVANSNSVVTVIGGNALNNTANFTGNTFTLTNNTLSGTASFSDNNNFGLATGIGGNAVGGGASANFTGNTFTIQNNNINSQITAQSLGGTNSSVGIGPNAVAGGSATFSNNNITMSEGQLNSTATTVNDSLGVQNATGMNMDGNGNTVTIDSMTFNILSEIGGNNLNLNSALGLNASGTSTIDINNSTVNVTAAANGISTATGFTGNVTPVNTTFNVSP